MTRVIYLDYNATTPLDPAVVDAMQPYLREHFGNPSSRHEYGRVVQEAVERSRAQVADLLGTEPDAVVFTSGGVPPAMGRGAVRLSVGRFTTTGEVDRAVELLVSRARRP